MGNFSGTSAERNQAIQQANAERRAADRAKLSPEDRAALEAGDAKRARR